MNEMSEKYCKSMYSMHQIEKSEDYILPDSYPDVKNVISCNCRFIDVKKYYGPTEAEIGATVVYNILFSAINNNGEAVLCSLNFKDEVKECIKYKYNNVSVSTKPEIIQTNCRMANPRKFAIKNLIKVDMFETVEENVYPFIECKLQENPNMQYLIDEIEVLESASVVLSEHSFSDNIEMDSRCPEIKELVYWNTDLKVFDEKRGENDVQTKLKGVFIISCIYIDVSDKYNQYSTEIPFNITLNDDEKATIGEHSGFSFIYPSANISAMNLNVAQNQYGESKVLEFDADYDIDLLLLGNKKVMAVKDAYSTNLNCEAEISKTKMISIDGYCKTNITCSEVNESSLLPNISCCIGVNSNIDEFKVQSQDKITGKVKNKIGMMSDDGNVILKEISSAFSCKNESLSSSGVVGKIDTQTTKLHFDSGKLYSDSELYFNLVSLAESNVNICKSVSNFAPQTKASDSVFSIYYQTPSDSLWNTAKLKKTTTDEIKKLNPDYDNRYASAIIIE